MNPLRLPVKVRQDRTHQAAGEIAALWQAERIQLHSNRFGQVVADGVAIDEAFQVAKTARSPRSLIGIGAGSEVAFGRQAVGAEFLAGIGVGRENEEESEEREEFHFCSNQLSLACMLTTLPTTISAGGLMRVSAMRSAKLSSVARSVRWVGEVPLQTTAAGVSGDRP